MPSAAETKVPSTDILRTSTSTKGTFRPTKGTFETIASRNWRLFSVPRSTCTGRAKGRGCITATFIIWSDPCIRRHRNRSLRPYLKHRRRRVSALPSHRRYCKSKQSIQSVVCLTMEVRVRLENFPVFSEARPVAHRPSALHRPRHGRGHALHAHSHGSRHLLFACAAQVKSACLLAFRLCGVALDVESVETNSSV